MAEPLGHPGEETVPESDEIVGLAFRRSLVVIAGIAALVGLLLLVTRRDAPAVEIREKDAGTIPDLVPEVRAVPVVRFTDVTAAAGIDFVPENGARGRKLLPETMGTGVAFTDYDGDGDPDLVFANACPWPGDAAAGPPPVQRLYANDGRGRFTDVTAAAGLDLAFHGTGVAAADYDGDGDEDLFFTAVGRSRLLRNDAGRFVDVTDSAGVAGDDGQWGTGAGFFDADGDGDLDLFVLRYIRWTPEIDLALNFTLNGKDRAYGPPGSYEGAHPSLYRNEGNGTFTDVSEAAGIRVTNRATGVPVAKSLGLTFLDYDGDGDLDVFVANDTVRNFLYRNDGKGTFSEVGEVTGFAYDGMGGATGAMGIDAAWYRNDAEVGIAIGNFANEMTSLYVSQGDIELFSDEAIIEGIGSPSRLSLTFGVLFLDYDLDGRQDFLQANGHLEDEIQEVQESQRYRQPAQLFWNAGRDARRCFVPVPATAETADLFRPIVGRGVAAADIDRDGDLDVVITQVKGPPLLLRNDQALGRSWLRVKLVGEGMNRDAIGARVELTAGGVTQRRMVCPTRGYLSQSETTLTFGLGNSAVVERLTVRWPDGAEEEVAVVGVDREITVRRRR